MNTQNFNIKINDQIITTKLMLIAQNETIIAATEKTSIPYYRQNGNEVRVAELQKDITRRQSEIRRLKAELK